MRELWRISQETHNLTHLSCGKVPSVVTVGSRSRDEIEALLLGAAIQVVEIVGVLSQIGEPHSSVSATMT
jgi:hypothetical protein